MGCLSQSSSNYIISWALLISPDSTRLIGYSSAVWSSVTSMAGLTSLLIGRPFAPFVFTTGPGILPCRRCTVPILPLLVSWGFVLCGLHSVVLHSQVGQSIHFCWYCLHKHIIQLPCCLPSLLLQVLLCQYCCDSYVFSVICDNFPVVVTQIVSECPLWSVTLGCTMTPYIHSPPSSC